MAKLHLTKVAFGCNDLAALQARIASRAVEDQVRIATRMRPRRADELIGGSLYWIVKHRLIACQQILRFEARDDGRIDIVCSAELVTVAPVPKRAHQGWRYFEATADTAFGEEDGVRELPPQLYGKLAALALV